MSFATRGSKHGLAEIERWIPAGTRPGPTGPNGVFTHAAIVACWVALAGCSPPLPARLTNADAAVRAEARAEWSELTPEQRFHCLRRTLRAGDGRTRAIAAVAIDGRGLDLSEIHAQTSALVPHLAEIWPAFTRSREFEWAGLQLVPIGSPDLPKIWRSAALQPAAADLVDALTSLHRSSLPRHVRDIVPLLHAVRPDLFRVLLWQLLVLAEESDDLHTEFARGLLYGLLRLRAERAGHSLPDIGAIDGEARETFRALAEATWGLSSDGGFRREPVPKTRLRLDAPHAWMLRRAREAGVTATDRPFLAQVATAADSPEARAWGVRCLARIGDRPALRAIAAGEDDAAFLAAAELARLGERRRFEEKLVGGADTEAGRLLRWYADPDGARRQWSLAFERERDDAAAVSEGEWPGSTGTTLWPESPEETQARWGAGIAADAEWIGEQLLSRGAAPALAVPYFVCHSPRALTGATLRRIVKGLSVVRPNGIDRLDEFLSICEVRDPKAAIDLLAAWAADATCAPFALARLAKLGEKTHAGRMIESWARWAPHEKWALGRVHDARVADFLRQRVAAGGPDVPSGLDALSTFYGVENPGFSSYEGFSDVNWEEEPYLDARRRICRGEPLDAVLRLADCHELSEWAAVTLAGRQDGRSVALLKRLRMERWRGTYWVATAALAASGDSEALTEWRAFLAEDRIWLMEPLARWSVSGRSLLVANGDETLIRHWCSRLAANCCLKHLAHETLSRLLPTMLLADSEPGDGPQKARSLRLWFEQNADRLRRSLLLDGLVPLE